MTKTERWIKLIIGLALVSLAAYWLWNATLGECAGADAPSYCHDVSTEDENLPAAMSLPTLFTVLATILLIPFGRRGAMRFRWVWTTLAIACAAALPTVGLFVLFVITWGTDQAYNLIELSIFGVLAVCVVGLILSLVHLNKPTRGGSVHA